MKRREFLRLMASLSSAYALNQAFPLNAVEKLFTSNPATSSVDHIVLVMMGNRSCQEENARIKQIKDKRQKARRICRSNDRLLIISGRQMRGFSGRGSFPDGGAPLSIYVGYSGTPQG
ncbi:MAG TPA: hypothetical protein VGJ33_16970 [Candidatus Angelobacter sp.]|jgi:hypothetical protein